jgi:mRNA interferase MazF
MQAGKIVLVDLLQSDGQYKLRPALVLKQLPKFNDFVVCGISTQLHQHLPGIDELIHETDPVFAETGLQKSSVVRLLYLAVVPNKQVAGTIGQMVPSLHKKLLKRLADFLVS